MILSDCRMRNCENKKAVDSLIEFIKYVGVDNVRVVGLYICKIPLISNTIDKKYGDRQKSLERVVCYDLHLYREEKRRYRIYISKI